MLQRAGRPTIENQQFGQLTFQTDQGRMNYNAGFFSFRKRTNKGLTLIFNYTISHCLDSGLAQSDSLGRNAEQPVQSEFLLRFLHHGCAAGPPRFLVVMTCRRLRMLPRCCASFWEAGPLRISSPLPPGFRLKVYAGDAFGSAPGGAGAGYDTAVAIGPVPKASANDNVTGSGGIATAGNPATGGTARQSVRQSRRRFLPNCGPSSCPPIPAPPEVSSTDLEPGTRICRWLSKQI